MDKIVLDNGLKIIFKHKDCSSVYIQASIEAGSIDEKEGEKGYSHLLEHLVFEGTKKRKDAQVIASEIENVGGELNAATSNENTVYFVKLRDKHFEKGIDVLSDMIINSTFEEDKVKKEKTVVLEEIKMVNDQPRYYQWILFEKHLLENSSYSFPVYGLTEDVSNATRESVIAYYNRMYAPNNATLIVVGNIKDKKDEVLASIKNHFGNWNRKEIPKRELTCPINKGRAVSESKDIQQVYLIQGFITPKITHEDAPVIEVIESILGKSQSGRVATEIRTKYGLAYDVSVSCEDFSHFGFFCINVGTDSSNISKVEEILKEQWKVLDVSEQELIDAKENLLGKMALEMENSSRQAELLHFWDIMCNCDYTEEYMKKLESVSLEDIKRVVNTWFREMTEIRVVPKQ